MKLSNRAHNQGLIMMEFEYLLKAGNGTVCLLINTLQFNQ